MGEANFSLMVKFESEAAREAGEEKVRKAASILNAIYDTWQSERGGFNPGKRPLTCTTDPEMWEALRIMGLLERVEQNPGNGLAFTISMPGERWTEWRSGPDWIEFGGMGSHLGDWSYNEKYLAAKVPEAVRITSTKHDLCCDHGDW